MIGQSLPTRTCSAPSMSMAKRTTRGVKAHRVDVQLGTRGAEQWSGVLRSIEERGKRQRGRADPRDHQLKPRQLGQRSVGQERQGTERRLATTSQQDAEPPVGYVPGRQDWRVDGVGEYRYPALGCELQRGPSHGV